MLATRYHYSIASADNGVAVTTLEVTQSTAAATSDY